LIKGVEEGDVDAIVSSHSPQDEESKKLEFDLADFGMLGLQTFLPMLLKARDGKIDDIIDRFTVNPRKILGIDVPQIREGEKAVLTIFDPEMEWTYNANTNLSKSVNSPWLGKKLKGAVIGLINNGRSFINDLV
jgi:dihydroorotase